jgi:hypothetical protein
VPAGVRRLSGDPKNYQSAVHQNVGKLEVCLLILLM